MRELCNYDNDNFIGFGFGEKAVCKSSNWRKGSLDFDLPLFFKAGHVVYCIKDCSMGFSCSLVSCFSSIASLQIKTAPSKMKPWQGYTHACVVALSVWFCRETIFEALQWWNGRSPSDGLILGSCILLTRLACIPIVAIHFSHVLPAKKCGVLVVATGLLFILIQPPLPLSLGGPNQGFPSLC